MNAEKLEPKINDERNRDCMEWAVFWFYGLSGAGKTTIANAAAKKLMLAGNPVIVLDGDEFRSGLCNDLGFSPEDRTENIRRAAEIAKLLSSQGVIVFAAFMSPQESMRELARSILGAQLCQVYVKCEFSLCAERDVKGLYSKADAGQIRYLPGKDLVFEEPLDPNVVLETGSQSVECCVATLLRAISAGLHLGQELRS